MISYFLSQYQVSFSPFFGDDHLHSNRAVFAFGTVLENKYKLKDQHMLMEYSIVFKKKSCVS